MVAGPGNEKAAGAVGRGHLRASHADREQVIDTLKAAFVQGRLTKDELEARAGHAFAARTYADLAPLTADLPVGLAGPVPPRRAVRAQARQPMSNAARAGMCVVLAVAVSAVLSFPTGGAAFLLFTPFFSMALAAFIAAAVVSRLDKRSHRRRPPRPGQRPAWAVGHPCACRQPVRAGGFRPPVPVTGTPRKRRGGAFPAGHRRARG
jgi:hypothetical protein